MRIPHHLPVAAVAVAWLMFIGSLFLSANNRLEMPGASPGTPLTGWQAFAASLVVAAHPLVILAEPRTLLFLFLTFPFINLAMLLAPLVVFSCFHLRNLWL